VKGSVRAEEKLKRDRAAQQHSAYVEKARTERAAFAARQARESERRLERLNSLRDEAKKQHLAERDQLRQSRPAEKTKRSPAVPKELRGRVAPQKLSNKPAARENVHLKATTWRTAKIARGATPRVSAPRTADTTPVQPRRRPFVLPSKKAGRARPIVQDSQAQRDRPQMPPARERVSHRTVRDEKRARRLQLRQQAAGRRLAEVQQLRSAKQVASSRAETQRQGQVTVRVSDRKASDDQRSKRKQLQKSIGLRRAEEHRQSLSQKQVQGSPAPRVAARGQLRTVRKLPPGARSAAGRAHARAARLTLASPTLYNEPADSLSWLRTVGSFIVDENGAGVALRGVSISGLDTAAPGAGQTLASALSLDEANITTLSDLWGINIVRLPFQAQTILAGNRSFSADALLAGLDDLIAELASLNVYVLLSLQAPPAPPHASVVLLPDQNVFDCWRLLAVHYQDEPAVLFEIYSSSLPMDETWLSAAQTLIGVIRSEHPASLLFVGSGSGDADTTGLPVRFTTGDPTPNIVYTLAVASGRQLSLANESALTKLSQSFPVFASDWSTSSTGDLDRSAESAANLFSRYGIGWAAASWNAEPKLVIDAAAHNFVSTRWGNSVQRAMTLPLKEPLDKLLPQ
jgi:hypothetical protein